jgi:hypothetical protein
MRINSVLEGLISLEFINCTDVLGHPHSEELSEIDLNMHRILSRNAKM